MSAVYNALATMFANQDGAQKRAGVLFGTVRTIAPLSIELESKLTLPKEFLTLPEHLTDYEIPFEILNPSEATHAEKRPTVLDKIAQIAGFFVQHEGRHDVQVEPGTLEDFHGEGTIKLYNHLLPGDRVILLRMENGNMYIVMDRIGKAEEHAADTQ